MKDFMSKLRQYLFIFPIVLVSCANGDIYSEMAENLKKIFSTPDDISAELVNSIPYASMQVRLGRNENTLIILEEEKNDILKWTSSNLIKIYTKNGFIIRLKGLGNELDLIELDRNHPIELGTFYADSKSKIFTSFYTFNNPKLYRLPVKTKLSFLKTENIGILGNLYKVKVFEEESLDNLISWKFKNIYWVDEDDQIIKAEQNFTPKNPKISLTITKQYKKPE